MDDYEAEDGGMQMLALWIATCWAVVAIACVAMAVGGVL